MLNIYLTDEQVQDIHIEQFPYLLDGRYAIAKAAADNAVKVVVDYLEEKGSVEYLEASDSPPPEAFVIDIEDWQALKELALDNPPKKA